MMRLLKQFVSYTPPNPLEFYGNHRLAKTNPTEIVTAAIIKSIAEYYEDWEATGPWEGQNGYDRDMLNNWRYESYEYNTCFLTNEKKGLKIRFGWKPNGKVSGHRSVRNYWQWLPGGAALVNDILLDAKYANMIVDNWLKKHKAELAVKEAADTAARNMQQNENAWNLVEKLLNLKRNEHGALIPVQEIEHEIHN